jgi:hypothetical protein
MMTLIKRQLAVAALLLCSFHFGFAQGGAPNGLVTFNFGSGTNITTVPVYDLSGDYQFTQQIKGAGGAMIDLSFFVTLTESVTGQLTGSGVAIVSLDTNFFAATYSAHGRISGGLDSTRVTLSVRLSGSDVVAGVDSTFKISVNYKLDVTPSGITGTARGNASFSGLSGGPVHSDITPLSLPPGVNGNWNVVMNILPLQSLGGTGVITLSNGRLLNMKVGGHFSAKTGVSKVTLTGVNDSRGNTLKLSFLTDATEPDGVNGKLFGQKVKQ